MLVMRELSRDDVDVINRWRSSRELISFLGSPFRFIAPEVDAAWFESYLQNRSNTVRCVTVDDSAPSKPLCLTTLAGIDWVNRCCVLHIMIGDGENRGKGIGSFSVSEMVRHAFLDLNLHRIELAVLESNAHARALYEKVGFKYEGVKRQAKFKDRAFENMCMMALLRDEWDGLDAKKDGAL